MKDIIFKLVFSVFLLSIFIDSANAQHADEVDTTRYYGAPKSFATIKKTSEIFGKKSTRLKTTATYHTYTYTFDDLVIFSYNDNTEIDVKNSSGNLIWEGVLNAYEYKSFSPGV